MSSRRNASRADKAKGAVSELLALKREGGKRAEKFSVKQEAAVYDVVDEKNYAELVAKRRNEHGGFVVEDEGLGYADIGEEDDWDRADDGDVEGDDAEEEAEPANKRKGDSKGAKQGKEKKKKKPEVLPQHRSVAGMFVGAKASAAMASKKDTKVGEDADGLLEDIMGGLDDDDDMLSRPVVPRAAVHAHPAPMSGMGGFPSSSAAARFRPSAPIMGGRAPPPHAARAPAPVPSLPRKRPLVEVQAEPEAQEEEDDDDDGAAVVNHGDDDSDGEAPASPAPPSAKKRPQTAAASPPPAAADVTGDDTAAPGAGSPAAAAPAKQPKAPEAPAPEMEAIATTGSGWQEVMATQGGEDAEAAAAREVAQAAAAAAALAEGGEGLDAKLLDADGTLPFYFLDAHEEPGGRSGVVHVFGKVAVEGQHVSCCVRVTGMQSAVYVVPNEGVFRDDEEGGKLEELEAAVAKGEEGARGQLMRHLHGLAAGLKAEVREALVKRGVKNMSMTPVRRSYAFERDDIPRGEQWVLKVRIPAGSPPLPSDLKGDHFAALLGTQTSLLEALLLKRKIMGPQWLAIANPVRVAREQQASWCKLELVVSSGKDVRLPAEGGAPRETPPLVVAAINLKTYVSPQHGRSEIAAASVVFLNQVKVDGPTAQSEWNTAERLRAFTVVRRLEGRPFPPGFEAEVRKRNESPQAKRSGGLLISAQGSERALLSFLLAKLNNLDADVVVGHNVGAFDLDVLLHRLQACKVPHWSRLGRLRRNKMPHLGGGGNQFGGGASPGVLAVMAGRLLCDTYLSSREFVKEVNYTLAQLSKSLLGQSRLDVGAADVPHLYEAAPKLLGLVSAAENDAWLSLGLMFHLSVLPLTRQLTNLCGSLWSKTLQGARAQRIEYLLLHEFHARKFLLPDKLSFKEKERVSKAAKAENMEEGGEDDGAPDEPAAGGGRGSGGKRRGAPAYAGGLVLEPKKGLYDKFVVMLDFNSLYPSIIQEYNICFTTVQRADGDGMAPLPEAAASVEELAVLPSVIRKLVMRRRQVKDMLKTERDVTKKQQLDIRQQALKLTANSMYGCLGFANSRFYAKPLAELVTSQGRDILQSTVDLVQGTMELEVIYGDTDSIMIHTGSDDLNEVKKVGTAVKREVNKRYRLLEIEIDGVFKRMLLLKKKKYAALKVEPGPDGTFMEVMEQKGLDIVRRDWCPLSKDVGNFALQEVLSGKPREDVVEAIHAKLRQVREQMDAGQVPVGKYIITKQLTKRPEDYPDARNQPHVQVALRRRAANKRDGVASGETVPYIICKAVAQAEEGAAAEGAEGGAAAKPGPSTANGKGLAERAYHPEEVRTSQGKLAVDIDYYLAQQVHPVVSRLCSPIEGTDAAHLAHCLGLDESKFRAQAAAQASGREDALLSAGSMLDDDDRYKHCEPTRLKHFGGGDSSGGPQQAVTEFDFCGVRKLLSGEVHADRALAPPPGEGGKARVAIGAHQLVNQVRRLARGHVQRYYEGWMRCDDEMFPLETRDVSLRALPDHPAGTVCADPKATGRMVRVFGEAELFTQLTHMKRQLDVGYELNRIKDEGARQEAAARVAGLRTTFDQARKVVEDLIAKSGYQWVDMAKVCAPAPATPVRAEL